MSKPQQVREQAEAANRHFEELKAQEAPNDATPEPEVPELKVVEEAQIEDAPPKQEEQPAEAKEEENVWEQRYKSLQGMYNADVPRLRTEVKQLKDHVTQLEGVLAQGTPQDTETKTEPPKSYLTEEDVAEYGTSIDVMRRATREELSPLEQRLVDMENRVRKMDTEVVPQLNRVAGQQQQTANQSFLSELSRLVPDWQAINNETGFHNWLLEVDPLTGSTRQQYLEDAHSQLDVNRVANFFQAWLAANPQASDAQPTTPSPASELERQVAPGKSRSAPTTGAQDGKMYTPADIQQFYRDVTSGKFNGKDKERARIEADIFAAQRDGRIQQT